MYLLYIWLYFVIPTCFLPTLICLLNFYLMYFIANYLKSSWEIKRSKFLKKKYTITQQDHKIIIKIAILLLLATPIVDPHVSGPIPRTLQALSHLFFIINI